MDDKYEVAEWFGLSKSGWVFQPGYEVNDNNGDLLIPAAKLGQGGWYTAYLNDPINGKMYAYIYLNISGEYRKWTLSMCSNSCTSWKTYVYFFPYWLKNIWQILNLSVDYDSI